MTSSDDTAPLDEPRPHATGDRVSRSVVALLGSSVAALIGRSLVVLRYRTADGRTVVFPVQAVADGRRLIVHVGAAATKRWWRHFRDPAPIEVWIGREWRFRTAVVTRDGAVVDTYRRAYPKVTVDPEVTLVAIELADPPPDQPPLRGRALLRAWFVWVTIAEVLGFLAPALAGALTADAVPAVSLPALLVTGAFEGALLGLGQGLVLRAAVPGLPVRRWVAATAAGAVVAYGLGMLPSTTADSLTTRPSGLLVILGVLAGLLLLASIGTAQWLVLRHHVARSTSWIATTALAWLGGLGVFLAVCTPLWQPGQALGATVAIGAFGGLLMAATMAAITGAGLVRLLARRPPAVDGPGGR